MSLPAISVVMIVAHGGAGEVGRVLDALEAQTTPPQRFEVVLVDDEQGAIASAAVASRAPRFAVDVLGFPQRLGAWAARNAGWRRARGEIIVFLGADVLPTPGWLSAMVTVIESGSADVVGGVGARGDARAQLEPDLAAVCDRDPRSPLGAWALDVSAVALRRSVLECAHGFAPTAGQLADVELGLAAWEAGSRLAVAPGALARRLHRAPPSPAPSLYPDVLALFLRRPYSTVLAVACWLHLEPEARGPLASLVGPRPELDLGSAFQALFECAIPAMCVFTQGELLDHLVESTAADAGLRAELAGWLDAALAAGVHSERGPDGRPRLDRHHTVNWLETCTRFKEIDLRHAQGFVSRTPRQRAGARDEEHPRPASVRVCGEYVVEIDATALEALGRQAVISIPFPVAGPHQEDVSILETWPPELRDQLDTVTGVLKMVRVPRESPARLGYRFECLVHEVAACRGGRVDTSEAPARGRATLPEGAIAALGQTIFGPHPRGEPFERAEAIYRWIIDSTGYRSSTLDAAALLQTGVGTCLARARLFVNLCLWAGVPARERRGAMLGRRSGEGRTETVTRGHGVFSHVWAELLDPSRGWVPVEFLGAGWGVRMLTPLNVVDPLVRADVEQSSEAFERYYFGGLDPFRLHASDASARFPSYPLAPVRLDAPTLQRVLWGTRHRLSCTVTDLGDTSS